MMKANILILLTGTLMPIHSSAQMSLVLTVDAANAVARGNFTGAGVGNDYFGPMSVAYTLDNGGTSHIGQTWAYEDLLSVRVSIPALGFEFFRDRSAFTDVFSATSLPGAPMESSFFNLETDLSGNVVTRDHKVFYDVTSTVNDSGTPLILGDDFLSFDGFSFENGGSSYQYASWSIDRLIEFVISSSSFGPFTETFTVEPASAIPEPSEYMLMLSAIGLGFFVYRRQRLKKRL